MARVWILSFLLIFLTTIEQNSQDKIRQKREELNRLRKEIEIFESKIKQAQKEEKITLELIDDYEKKDNLLRRLIAELKKQIKENEQLIHQLQTEIHKSESEIQTLKEQYARYVRALYKRGRTHDLELILTAKSINQMLTRTVYLKKFTEHRKKTIDSIYALHSKLKEQKDELELVLSKQKDSG
ncbi:MAG: hypothetical protein ABDI07_02555 [Candidatus Kryptonium sp.]